MYVQFSHQIFHGFPIHSISRSFSAPTSTGLKRTLISDSWGCRTSNCSQRSFQPSYEICDSNQNPPLNKVSLKAPGKWQPGVAEKQVLNTGNGGPTR